MKKIALTAAVALLASAAVFADGFKLSGYVQAGYSAEMNDSKTASTDTWLGGSYFNVAVSSSRARLNFGWNNADDTAGAFFRLQYSGAPQSWAGSSAKVTYGYAYGSFLDKKVTVVGGAIADKWVGSDSWEGSSLLDGDTGAAVIVSPVEGLHVFGAVVNSYNYYGSYTISDLGKDAVVGGMKYANDMFSATAQYSGLGLADFSLTLTPIKGLTAAVDYEYATDDALNASWNDANSTFAEYLQYTGIDNLELAFVGYQFVDTALTDADGNATGAKEDSNLKVTLTPAVSYAITKVVTVEAEG